MSLENVLSMVDAPKPQPEAFITPHAREKAERAAKARFFAVLAEDPSATDRARKEASEAFKNTATAIMLAEPPPAASVMQAAYSDSGERGVAIDQRGAARSAEDVRELRANGLAMAEPLYTRGTRVVEWGVDNARIARNEYDALPATAQACADLVAQVKSEARADRETTLGALSWEPDGTMLAEAERIALTDRALSGLITRIGCGGHGYLANGCSPALRATNLSEQIKAREISDAPVVLRERNGKSGRVAYATVSQSYAAYDTDKIAEAVSLALPDTRASVVYDGDRVKIEALSHTTVAPENFVAGEVFRVGVRVSSDDTGGGSIKVDAIAFQNLCLNLIIIQQAAAPIARIRHVGTVAELAKQVREGLRDARNAIAPFLARWNAACAEDIRASAQSVATKTLPVADRDFVKGVFANLLDTKQIALPGYRADSAIDHLLDAWTRDHSSATAQTRTSRAAIVNAITRAAHELDLSDAFDSDAVERDAASLLWTLKGRKEAPALHYLDPELMGKRGDTASA